MLQTLVLHSLVNYTPLIVNSLERKYGVLRVARHTEYKFNDNAEPWYFHNLLRSPLIKALSTGIVESRLKLTDDLYSLEGLLPPLREQVAIARYLDYVDSRVRRLTEAKRKLIGLLTEQKQGIIHRAVTRGLDFQCTPEGLRHRMARYGPTTLGGAQAQVSIVVELKTKITRRNTLLRLNQPKTIVVTLAMLKYGQVTMLSILECPLVIWLGTWTLWHGL